MKFRSFSLIGSFLVVALVATSCSGGGGQQRRGQQLQVYPVLKLNKRSITLNTTYPANLQGYQTVEIRPRVEGNITKMLVDEGAQVQKGQTLFRISDPQYQQQVRSAKAGIQSAKSGVKNAKDEVERLQPLVEQNIISKYRLQAARDNLQSQQAALAKAKATLENAKVSLGYTYVKSPVDGTIGNIPYRLGSLVSSSISQPLTTVSDISEMYAYFSIGERELLNMSQDTSPSGGNKSLREKIKKMPMVNLILPDGTIYDKKGKIQLASGLIDQQTGSASFRAVFPNPNEILRSGGSGQIQIPSHQDSIIAIPKKSTYEVQNKTFVYTVGDSNKVQGTPIQVRSLSTKSLYVVKKGLSADVEIVVSGMGTLQDGAKIKPKPVNSDSLYKALTKEDKRRILSDSSSES